MLPRAAFKTLDFHLCGSVMMPRHQRSALSSRTLVVTAVAAADAEAMASSSSFSAAGGDDSDGIDLARAHEEEQLPTSFDQFDLDDRVTVCASLKRREKK